MIILVVFERAEQIGCSRRNLSGENGVLFSAAWNQPVIPAGTLSMLLPDRGLGRAAPVVQVTTCESRNCLRAVFRQHTGHPSHHPH